MIPSTTKLKTLLDYQQRVRRETGKSAVQQLREIGKLRRCNPTTTFWDYYHYRLYDTAPAQWPGFAGKHAHEALNQALNPRNVVSAAWDKLQLSALLTPCRLPVAPIRAVFKPHGGIPLPEAVALTSRDALRHYLLTDAQYPMFSKPAYSQQGIGAYLLADIDRERELLHLGNGKTLALADFLQQVTASQSDFYRPEAGYLFQDVLRQHPDISRFQGSDTISGLRVVVLNTAGGPRVHRVLWKLAIGRNSHDNFSLGAYGNLVGQVDHERGVMPYAVSALWPRAVRHQVHPDTRQVFAEFRLPHWQALTETVCAASRIFPLMKILHWDVVLGEQGPVLLELNDLGAIPFHQLCGNGFLDASLRELLRQHGNIKPGSALARSLQAP